MDRSTSPISGSLSRRTSADGRISTARHLQDRWASRRSSTTTQTSGRWARLGLARDGSLPMFYMTIHPGPVGAMRRWGQPEHDDGRTDDAEAGHRSAPIGLIGECATLRLRDFLPPRHQPRTGPAHRDPRTQLQQPGCGRGQGAHLAGVMGNGGARRRTVAWPAGAGLYHHGRERDTPL